MPNGHGGHVRFLPVIVLLVVLAGLLVYARKTGAEWAAWGGYGLAALAGERLAHHLHRWNSEEYDGAYYSGEEKAAARKTYIAAAVIYMIGGAVAWYFLTR